MEDSNSMYMRFLNPFDNVKEKYNENNNSIKIEPKIFYLDSQSSVNIPTKGDYWYKKIVQPYLEQYAIKEKEKILNELNESIKKELGKLERRILDIKTKWQK